MAGHVARTILYLPQDYLYWIEVTVAKEGLVRSCSASISNLLSNVRGKLIEESPKVGGSGTALLDQIVSMCSIVNCDVSVAVSSGSSICLLSPS